MKKNGNYARVLELLDKTKDVRREVLEKTLEKKLKMSTSAVKAALWYLEKHGKIRKEGESWTRRRKTPYTHQRVPWGARMNEVIALVNESWPIRAKTISKEVKISSAHASVILNDLKKQGLVTNAAGLWFPEI